jgi:hypothetical protein
VEYLHYSYKNTWKILEIFVLYLNKINPEKEIGKIGSFSVNLKNKFQKV